MNRNQPRENADTTDSFPTTNRTWHVLAAIGGLAWCGFLISVRPSQLDAAWARLLLLLGPLVLVPLGLGLWEPEVKGAAIKRLRSIIKILLLPTALLLAVAQCLDQGWLATALAAGWFVTTSIIAIAGLLDGWQNRRAGVDRLCIDAGLMYLAVGGAWVVIDRSAWRPLDFEPVIVMLTAIHFHFAGFVLPIVAGLTARRVGGSLATASCVGVVAGMPLVAIGITGTKLGFPPAMEGFAALWMSAAGMLAAHGLLRAAWRHPTSTLGRTMWTVAAVSLGGSMVLAAMYGIRHFLPISWLDISLMRLTHGTANAIGFALFALIGWTWVLRRGV